MKKFLLTLIVTMLACIGAWAQDISIDLYRNDGTSIITTESSPLVLDVNNSSGEKIWAKVSNSPGGATVSVEGNTFVSTSAFDWQGNWQISGTNANFTITPTTAGSGKVSVKVIVYEYPGGVQTPVEKYSLDLWVKVIDTQLATSFSLGSPSATEFYQGTNVTVPVTFAPETAKLSYTVSPEGQGVTANISGNTLTISATEEAAVGEYTITVLPKEGSVDENGDAIQSQSVTVTVKDKTHASSIDAPGTVSVAYGYKKDIPVTFEPAATAVVYVEYPTIEGVTFSPATLSGDNKTITVDATNATAAVSNTITLHSGNEGDRVSKIINLHIVEPIGVSTIDFTNSEIVDGKLTLAIGDAPITLNAVTNSDAANTDVTLTLTSNDGDAIIYEDGKVTPNNRGVAVVTATSVMNSAMTTSVDIEVTDVIPVTLPEPSSKLRVGETHSSAFVIGGGLSTEDYNITYTSSDPSVITVDGNATSDKKDNGGELAALKPGKSTLTVVVTPKNAALTQHYTAYTNSIEITVVPGEYGLTIAATPTSVTQGTAGTVAISSENVTLNGDATTKVKGTDYIIVYSLEGASDGITINPTTGEVSVPTTAPTQQFAIVATLAPEGDDAANYKGAVAKTAVLVAGDGTGGVTLTKHSHMEDDVEIIDYIEVYVPTPGAFGTLANPTVNTSSSDATIENLQAAANIKVTGLIKNSDVQVLVDLVGRIGGDNAENDRSKVKVLDMGNAKMTEAVVKEENGRCSLVPSSGRSLMNLESLTLPQPAVGVAGGTVLPKGMGDLTSNQYNWPENSLTTLIIPEGWTEVANEAWGNEGGQAHSGQSSAVNNLTSIQFPETLTKIGNYAFSNSSLSKIFFPPYIEYIGEGAFNTATKLSDVYFTGDKNSVPAIKYVHPDAFSLQTQMVNNCIEKDEICNGKHMPTMNRTHYVNGGVYACILHFPEGLDEYYTDVTRKYKVMDTSEESGFLYNKNTEGSIYVPENWTSTWVSQMSSLSANQNMMTNQDGVSVSGGFPDDVYGYSMIWPSQYQMTCGYTIANAGYLWNGQPMDPMTQYDPTGASGYDLRGLYQFIIAMGNAPEDPKEWTFHYELDKWYTIALPFDMSPAQIKDVFGPKTQVCRFSGVTRVAEGDDKKIVLEFRNSVMKENDGRAEDNRYDVTQIVGATGVGIVTMDFVDGGIQHHWPYMIKPGGKAEGQFEMKFKNYKAETGILNQDKVNSTSSVSSEQAKQYAFSPILTKQYYDGEVNDGGGFKKNSYIFVNKINGESVDHQYVFFKGIKDGHGGYRDGGTVNAFTAYVQLAHGQDECNTFFGGNTQNQAPIYASIFGDDDEVNGIEKVVIACGTDSFDDDKIYTINGVLVNGRHLAPGLYIKNGKKFIVK